MGMVEDLVASHRAKALCHKECILGSSVMSVLGKVGFVRVPGEVGTESLKSQQQ